MKKLMMVVSLVGIFVIGSLCFKDTTKKKKQGEVSKIIAVDGIDMKESFYKKDNIINEDKQIDISNINFDLTTVSDSSNEEITFPNQWDFRLILFLLKNDII